MKKTGIVLALSVGCITFSVNTQAQGIYFGLGGGYGFAAAKADFGSYPIEAGESKSTQTVTNGTVQSSTLYTANSFSLGKGINLGLFGGYMINKNVGVELGIGYLFGSSTQSTEENDQTNISSGSFQPTVTETSTSITTVIVKGSMLRLTPSLRLQCGEAKIHPYAVVGLIIGVAGKFTKNSEDITSYANSQSTGTPPAPQPNSDDVNILTYNGGISFGFHGAVGVNYLLTEKLGIFAELAGNYQDFSPDKGVLTTSTTNGSDNLPKMTVNETQTTYSSTFTSTSGGPATPGTPYGAPSFHIPFSSYGFTIGVHFTLGGK